MPSKMQLANEAIYIEKDVLKECVGCQDQVAASFGGLNRISFRPGNVFDVQPIILDGKRLVDFQNHLMLFFTGFSRYASEIAQKQVSSVKQNTKTLSKMLEMVDESIEILVRGKDILQFGNLMHESWVLKRGLASEVSTPQVDSIYERARNSGAVGGKLIGAGGGGFMLLFVKPENQERVREALKELLLVPFRFENSGTQIIFYRPDARKTDVPFLKKS